MAKPSPTEFTAMKKMCKTCNQEEEEMREGYLTPFYLEYLIHLKKR